MAKTIYNLINQAAPKGKFELNEKQVQNLKLAGEVVLALIGAVGVATVAIVAPNALKAIDRLFLKHRSCRLSRKEKVRKTMQTFYYLKRSGLIRFKSSAKDVKIFVTSKGAKKLEHISLNALTVPKSKKWDSKWWQVAADIPTRSHRRGADLLRKKIKEMGFYPLQRTLWLYPFDPREEVQFISDYFGVANFVTIMEISRLDREDESVLLEFFKRKKVL